MKKIDIVVPAYNEAEALKPFHSELCKYIDSLPYCFRLIIVDDGSDDDTPRVCKALSETDARVGYIRLSRNFGHQAALTAGLDAADADAVITMDADLEHPPSVIGEMVSHWEKGAHVVNAVRRGGPRGQGVFKAFSSKLFYRVFNLLSDVPGAIDSADFRLLDKKVVQAVRSMREQSRFLRGIYAWAGFKQANVDYVQGERVAGEPKYTTSKSLALALSAVLSFSRTPLRLSTYLGILVSFMAFIYGLYAMAQYFVFQKALPGWTSIAVLVSFLSGIQLLTIGVLGEYLGRVLEEVKNRPLYLVEEKNLPVTENLPVPGKSPGHRGSNHVEGEG